MSEKEQKERARKQLALTADLQSGDMAKVQAALKRTEKLGDATHVRPLLIAFRDTEEGQVRDELRTTLSSIKLSQAQEIYLEALEEEAFESIRADILSFTWNAGFTPGDSVDLITRIGLNGDYMTAVEAMTLIESIPGPLDEESLLQALVIVREFMLEHKESGHPNFDLALSIFDVLSAHERNQ